MMAQLIYILLVISPFVYSAATPRGSHHVEYVETFEETFEHLLEELPHNQTVQREVAAEEQRHAQFQVHGAPFPCQVYPPSPTVPTSVHALRPGDIKVVAAMGDSITAALGADANNIFGMLTEYRGYSWSIGGDSTYEEQETLPNILKKYNPSIKGFSIGTGEDVEESRLNVAVSGSIASDLPSQARELIDRMKADPDIDFENDWKVITIMSGGNDICDVCLDEEEHSPSAYIMHVTSALDILKEEVPRVFVNLVVTINVGIAKDLNDGLVCTVIHLICRCAAFPDGEEGEKLIEDTTMAYHTDAMSLIASGRYDTSDDFTVVVQPFLDQTFLPRLPDNSPDMSFFAPDCFHLSRKGQAAAANGLWNNMIQREGQKDLIWSPGEPIDCPTEASPYFFTRKNSNTTAQASASDAVKVESNNPRLEPEYEVVEVDYAVDPIPDIEVMPDQLITHAPRKMISNTDYFTYAFGGVGIFVAVVGLTYVLVVVLRIKRLKRQPRYNNMANTKTTDGLEKY